MIEPRIGVEMSGYLVVKLSGGRNISVPIPDDAENDINKSTFIFDEETGISYYVFMGKLLSENEYKRMMKIKAFL